jgi:hypothetical protein
MHDPQEGPSLIHRYQLIYKAVRRSPLVPLDIRTASGSDRVFV